MAAHQRLCGYCRNMAVNWSQDSAGNLYCWELFIEWLYRLVPLCRCLWYGTCAAEDEYANRFTVATNIKEQSISVSQSLRLKVAYIYIAPKMTHTTVLQGFINWTLADESSRKHEFSHLLGQLQLTKCNPAYLKHVLNTYGTTLTIDQGICAEVKESRSLTYSH